MNLYNLIQKYEGIGYEEIDATAKVAQDIILLAISKSKFNKNITIKVAPQVITLVLFI